MIARLSPVTVGAIVGLASIGQLSGCSRTDKTVPAMAAVNVKTAVVSAQPFNVSVGAIGVVTGRPGHVALLAAPAGARVRRVMTAVGQRVGAGTPLIELDATAVHAARTAADAALVNARSAHARVRLLVQQGILPRKDLDQATADLEQARSNATNARQQEQLSVIRTPIGGVVTRVSAALGAVVDPTQVLVEVVDPRALDILFSVTPSEAGRVRIGATATLRDSQDETASALGEATITDISEAVDAVSRGVTIRAQSRESRRPLRVGETVFGEIVARFRTRAIVVPMEAVVPMGDGFRVFVVDAAGFARARPVAIGARTSRLVEVTNGLSAGERIVTYGAYGIEDSAKVASMSDTSATRR